MISISAGRIHIVHLCFITKQQIMKAYQATFEAIYWRFQLMIFIVVAAFAIGAPLLGILAVPIFFSCLMGIQFFDKKERKTINFRTAQQNKLDQAA